MPFNEERIFIDLEIPVSPDLSAIDAKKVIERAIRQKLEELPTDIYKKLDDECNIIVFRTVRGKGGP